MMLEKGTKHARTTQTRSERRAKTHMPISAPIWALEMTIDDHAVTTDASIRNSDAGTAAYVVDALEQALLLPEDMHELRMMQDQNVFMTLKKELTMVRILFSYHSFPSSFVFRLFCFNHLSVARLMTCKDAVQSARGAEEIGISSYKALKSEETRRNNTQKTLEVLEKKLQKVTTQLNKAESELKSADAALKTIEK